MECQRFPMHYRDGYISCQPFLIGRFNDLFIVVSYFNEFEDLKTAVTTWL